MSETRLPAWSPAQERLATVVIHAMTALNVWLYRLSGGWLGGRFLRGAPICLVTTRGRRSGEPRTVALLYLRDGDRVVLVGSKGGMSHHPAWYLNLRAEPSCEVQIGSERMSMRAGRPGRTSGRRSGRDCSRCIATTRTTRTGRRARFRW